MGLQLSSRATETDRQGSRSAPQHQLTPISYVNVNSSICSRRGFGAPSFAFALGADIHVALPRTAASQSLVLTAKGGFLTEKSIKSHLQWSSHAGHVLPFPCFFARLQLIRDAYILQVRRNGQPL